MSDIAPAKNAAADDPTVRMMLPAFDSPARVWSWPSRLAVFAVIIAVIALAVACGAIVTAWAAVAEAGRPPAATTPAAARATSPAPAPSTALPTGYVIKYAQEPLRVAAGCGIDALVDLDGPRTNALETDADLRFRTICGSAAPRLVVQLAGRAGSVVADPETDVPGCLRAIQATPLDPGESVPVPAGTAVCVVTADPVTPVLAVVEITGTDPDGGASLRASGWSAAP